jgi:hypothetical protein
MIQSTWLLPAFLLGMITQGLYMIRYLRREGKRNDTLGERLKEENAKLKDHICDIESQLEVAKENQ